ncbi:polysaccharide biosynthesis protein [Picosynechococcus sp. PCC 7003]|uniref:lipopolysaccharide biosynthesis protein n=1 Tax=Picosynechococcus sp. PCC 7003 TaxID=374981 RepID=UPI0008109C86|nr:oligosaccharide flippase family protein [Picosynechococcus sp. PCC 7003]ANV84456.1 polysaccharide biosynthesis protein [Picosynechococcus sp. PCC 7003]
MAKLFLADRILRKILKNFSWLLCGQILTAIANFAYLSLTAHTLGVVAFGQLILVRAYVELIIGLTTFQSWQALIRYGADYLKNRDYLGFQNLVKLTTCLDFLGSLGGYLIAVVAAPFIGPLVGWDAATIHDVQRVSILILFTLSSTPIGLLRLYDRFDLLAVLQMVAPLVRLLGTAIAIWLEAPLVGYLLAWLSGEAANGLCLLAWGWWNTAKKPVFQEINWSLKPLLRMKPQIFKFCLVSNLNSSLPLAITLSPLIVGVFANPSAVALFRAGYEFSTPLKDLALLFTQSVYPELAHLSAKGRWRKFRNLLWKLGRILLGIGVTLLVAILLGGKILLYYSMGSEFTAAYAPLVLLIMAGLFLMGNYLLEPALFSMEMPHLSLRNNAIAILLVYLPLLMILAYYYGAWGAGLATLIANGIGFSLNLFCTWQELCLRQKKQQQNRSSIQTKQPIFPSKH